jgi:NAD(P)-dependent dehydrogenase (short-subunit alcohol dehydrogenase family)
MTGMAPGGGRLSGRVALVTGAAGGIGSAVARAFARESVALCLADQRGVEGTAAEAAALGARAIGRW